MRAANLSTATIALLSVLLAGVPAAASGRQDTRPEPTPAEIAAARAEGDRLIAEANASEWFEYVGGGRDAWVLHRRSGLVCRFEVGRSLNRIMVFESEYAAPGDDVGCNMPRSAADLTMYATRYSEPITAEQAVYEAIAGIQGRYPQWSPYDGEILGASLADLQTYVGRMVVTLPDGRRFYTHAVTAEVDGWIIKQRLSAPEESSMDGQMAGFVDWAGIIGFAQTRPFDQMD